VFRSFLALSLVRWVAGHAGDGVVRGSWRVKGKASTVSAPPRESDPSMLPRTTVPRSLSDRLAAFRPCLIAPTFPTFAGLLVGLIAQTRRRTVCGMLTGAGLDQVWHHSRAHRLFTTVRWSVDALGLAMADLIVARLLLREPRSRSPSTTPCSSGPGRKYSGWPGITTGPRRARNPSVSVTAGSWPASWCSRRFCPARCACRCWPGVANAPHREDRPRPAAGRVDRRRLPEPHRARGRAAYVGERLRDGSIRTAAARKQ